MGAVLFVGYNFACVGRALEWHSRGHGFDPHHLHQKKAITKVIAFFSYIRLWRVILLCSDIWTSSKLYSLREFYTANIISLKPQVSISHFALAKYITPTKSEYHLNQENVKFNHMFFLYLFPSNLLHLTFFAFCFTIISHTYNKKDVF